MRTALKEGKQVYIFIDKNILAEYETYLLNKDSEASIRYKYVDNIRVYKFIEEIRGLSANNNIKGFETASDITIYLKEQFAGLFQRFLEEQTRIKEVSLITNLEKTAQTLNKLVNFLSEENKGQVDEINRILTINHPLVEELRNILDIPYNFFIEGLDDLSKLLSARGFNKNEPEPWDESTDYYQWTKKNRRKVTNLEIVKKIFDEDGRLKFYKKTDWDDNNVKLTENETGFDADDLPF